MTKKEVMVYLVVLVLLLLALVYTVQAMAQQVTCASSDGWVKVDSDDLSQYPVSGATQYCFKAGSDNAQGCTGGTFGSWPQPEGTCGLSHWSYYIPMSTPTPSPQVSPSSSPVVSPSPMISPSLVVSPSPSVQPSVSPSVSPPPSPSVSPSPVVSPNPSPSVSPTPSPSPTVTPSPQKFEITQQESRVVTPQNEEPTQYPLGWK